MENKVIDKFEEYCNLLDEGCPVILLTALKLLKEQPEIVRCKDCIHMKVMPCDIHGHIPIYCTNLGIYSEGLDWFCADGERK